MAVTPPTALDQLLNKLIAVNGIPMPVEPYLNLVGVAAADNPTFEVGGQPVGATDVYFSASVQETSSAATTVTVAQAGAVFLVDTSAGAYQVLLPPAATMAALGASGDGLWWEFVDVPSTATGGHTLGQSGWANNPLTVGGNGNSLVDPNDVGQTGVTGSSCQLKTARGRFRFTWSVAAQLFLV